VGPRAGLDTMGKRGGEQLAPNLIRTPDSPARSLITTLNTL